MAIELGARGRGVNGNDAPARSPLARLLTDFFAAENAPLRAVAFGIALLTLLRFLLGAYLPLAFDEAYYWLWSKHLAFSYFDHPPAIAYAIRMGTALFGDTAFGVRAAALLLSVLASWAVWRSARLLLADRDTAALACLYFNITLMVAAESMAATPDALALAAASLVLFALAKVLTMGDGRWWLAVGASGGLCLLSKYTGFFLGAGVAFWLVATVHGRKWLSTPWPYAGGLVALALFLPVILWNASHDWISFKFQFGRVAAGGLTARYVLEFLLAQAMLASPFVLVLAGMGFARATRFGWTARPVSLAALLVWPAFVYFMIHALHDRVQGNWPSFAFPALALLAAYAGEEIWRGNYSRAVVSFSRGLAVPFAAVILAVVYAQGFFQVIPVRDPVARLAAFGIHSVTDGVEKAARSQGAQAVLTTSYATTSWLAFYMSPPMPVVQINENYRWFSAPEVDLKKLGSPLLYVTQRRQEALADVAARFSEVRLVARIPRRRGRAFIEEYDVYSVSGLRRQASGREP